MKKAINALTVALGLTVGLVQVTTSCGGGQSMSFATNEYPVRTLESSNAELSSNYPAAIKGKQDIEIRPNVSGFITRLCVDEGATVHSGQVLFLIDDVQFRSAVEQAEAALNTAQAAQSTAELTYQNKQELHNQGIIGDFDLQTAQNALAQAKASVEQAKAAVTSARRNLSFCSVTSPSNGVIGSIPYRVGSLVGPSIQTPLTTVSNNQEMYVYFSINEKQVLELTRQAEGGSIAAAFPEVNLKLADGSIYEHAGHVTTISGVIGNNGDVQIRADFPNPTGLLKTGGSGTIMIPYNAENVVIIPQSATIEVQDKIFVYVVDKDNKVNYTAIEVNPENDGKNYIVTKGLNAGDRIVTNGITKLTDGQEIQPVTEEQYEKSIEDAQKLGAIQGNYKEMKKAFSK